MARKKKGDPRLAAFQLRTGNCRGCIFADEALVGTGLRCCTYPGLQAEAGGRCLTRRDGTR